MGNYVSNLLYFPSIYKLFSYGTQVQKTFMQQTVMQDLDAVKSDADCSLKETDFKKIEYYYGNAVASILGEGFCLLRGTDMTNTERTALTYIGALSGIFDDFFDELDAPHGRIKLLIDKPQEVEPQNSHEKLFLIFWQKAMMHLPDLAETKKFFHQLLAAQILSQQQKESTLSDQVIYKITYDKGAISFQLYRSAFGKIENNPERKMIDDIGALAQLENDIFDVYKDSQNNIHTPATRCKKINDFRKIYNQLFEDIKSGALQTPYEKKNIQAFIRFLSAIVSRGYVCLDYYEKMEMENQDLSFPIEFQRSNLICDMEKLANKLRSLHYYTLKA